MIEGVSTMPVLGTELAVTTYADLSGKLFQSAKLPGCRAIDFSNTHIVTMRRHDPDFQNMTSAMDLFVPDGMPLIWCLNAKGANLRDRVYGPSFMRILLENSPPEATHYLIGGLPECATRLKERMLALNPKLNFVGGFHGLCTADGSLQPPAEDERIVQDLKELQPTFIWVGLGTPKQYAWITRIKPKLKRGFLLAVGFAFDVNAGTKPDAPLWMQRAGLTWAYRICSEPRRLLGRYLKWNSLFAWYLLSEMFSGKNKKL